MTEVLRRLAATLFLLVCVLGPVGPVHATVQFDTLFTDGTILQQGTPVAIYGVAAPGEQVSVVFQAQQKQVITASDGSWLVYLDPMSSGGPFTLTASAENSVSIEDVRVGEVWLCAGQSNMLKGVLFPDDLAAEPEVRWRRFGGFVDGPGAVCWLFAVQLRETLGVPVMVINNARGGSKIRQWMPLQAVPDSVDPAVDDLLAGYADWGRWQADVDNVQPYTFRGVVWWQGESDRKTPLDHQHLLPALIRSWRAGWGQGDLPFIIMQLPTGKGMAVGAKLRRLPRRANRGHRAADMRQAFFMTQRDVPGVSMVTNGDLRGGTHPPKPERPLYAQRIADTALANVYDVPLAWSGPIFESMTAEGNGLRLAFRESTAAGLKSVGGPLQGFALSADGEHWEWADSVQIEGEEVVVSSSLVPAPFFVRYGWGKRTSFANLFNAADLTASPFLAELE